MAVFKKILAGIILLGLCAYATWKGMQILSIVAIILFLCTLFTSRVVMLFDLFFSLAKQAKQAKFGNFEFSIGDSFKQVVLENINPDKEWVKAIISDLSPTDLTILLAVNKAGEYQISHHVINTLRVLRAKGLIKHNKDTMEKSTKAWLTEIGAELVNEVTTVKTDTKQSE